MMGRNNKPTGGGHGEEEDGDKKRMWGAPWIINSPLQ
jgi:hypothetical protein